MALNFENEETENRAKAVARLTGESMTAAITEAVRESLDRVCAGQGHWRADTFQRR